MKNRIISLFLFLAMMNTPASFASSLEAGLKYYRNEEYRKAQKLLEKARGQDYKNWRVHYYLGNTYLALGKFISAEKEYEIAETFCKNDDDLKLCCMAKLAVEKYIIQSQSVTSRMHAANEDARKNIQMAAEAYKSRVKDEAAKQVAFIRKQADEQIEAEKSCTQQILRYADGTMTLDMPPYRKAQIKADAERQCEAVKQTAQKSIESFR